MEMISHSARIAAILLLIVLIMVYPFLPGQYDALAMPLSTVVQLLATVSLLLVPLGALWLVYELRKRARRNQNLPGTNRGYYFALFSLIAASLLIILLSLFTFFGVGMSLGVLTLVFWFYVFVRLLPGLKLMKKTEPQSINPAPFYLIFISVVLLLFQLALARPLTEFSRNYAIAHSAEFNRDIEAYRTVQGHYPHFLLATWKDYYPSIVGIEKFHYTPNGDSYDLFFEQPRFLLDNLGTREFVVYNPLDEHMIISHTSWILLLPPEELQVTQGWYAAHDAASPHWRYFWFD
jgi:hypothetical protein